MSYTGRFYDRVAKGSQGECWTWTGGHTSSGTPMFDESADARKASWRIHKGSPPEAWIRTTCSNASCVNPDHLMSVARKVKPRSKLLSPIDRFWSYVNKGASCWEWTEPKIGTTTATAAKRILTID